MCKIVLQFHNVAVLAGRQGQKIVTAYLMQTLNEEDVYFVSLRFHERLIDLLYGEFNRGSYVREMETGTMKKIEEKLKRKVKYFRVRCLQASGRDRSIVGLYSLTILVYVWWYILLS